jgi:hypothetical protein
VKEKTPWFWTVKGFISKRPNLVPTGVGNNSTGYDVSILQKGTISDHGDGDGRGSEDEDKDGFGDESLGLEDEFDGQSEPNLMDEWANTRSGSEDEEAEDKDIAKPASGREEGGEGHEELTAVGEKRRQVGAEFDGNKKKVKVDAVAKKPTAPRAGKSAPATTASSSSQKKSRTGIEKLSEIAAKEEETTQKIIDLKKTKAEGAANKEITKVKSKADIEMNRDKLKADLASQKLELDFKLKKMEWEYKLKLAQLELQSQEHRLSTTSPSPGAPHHAAHNFAGFSSLDQQNTFSSGTDQWTASIASSSNAAAAPQPSSSSNPQSLTEELNSDTFNFGDVGNYNNSDIYQ